MLSEHASVAARAENEASTIASTENAESQDSHPGFPTETLPPVLKDFVRETAATLSVVPDLIAVPALVVCGAAIGNSRQIHISNDWQESASLYATVVAESGSTKSPALQKAVQPLLEIQSAGTARTWASDTTIEQLGFLLHQNSRGLLLYKDELSGLVFSMNQYKNGRGADRQFYLSAWSGTAHAVDRRDGTDIRLPRPFLSVVGAIPPSLLHHLQGRVGEEDGFMPRLLFAYPEPAPERWMKREVPEKVKNLYTARVRELFGLDYNNAPIPIPMSHEADQLFEHWVNELLGEMQALDFWQPLRPYYAKFKGYAARLALIHTLATDPAAKEVGQESLMAAFAQVDYFKAQAEKVVGTLQRMSVVGSLEHKVNLAKEGIRRKLSKGRFEKRDIQRSMKCDGDVFKRAWVSVMNPEVIKGDDGLYGLNPLATTDIPTTDTASRKGGK